MSDEPLYDDPTAPVELHRPHIDGIDASKFERQGRPTKAQAKVIWDEMREPSSRKVAAVLEQRGFDISWRTIARWNEKGWVEDPNARARASRKNGRASGADSAMVRQALRKEADVRVTKQERQVAKELTNGEAPTVMTDAERELADRRDELMQMTDVELDVVEAKARRVMNIMMMEQAGKRAHVMMLIPKDTAAFVEAMTDARRVMNTGSTAGAIVDKPHGSKHPGDGDIIDVVPNKEVSPLTSAINKFLQSEGMV
jgi:hypothetical protein